MEFAVTKKKSIVFALGLMVTPLMISPVSAARVFSAEGQTEASAIGNAMNQCKTRSTYPERCHSVFSQKMPDVKTDYGRTSTPRWVARVSSQAW